MTEIEIETAQNEIIEESNAHDVVIVRGSPVSNDTVELSYRIFLPQLT